MGSEKNSIDTKKIKHLLIDQDLAQKDLARRIGVSQRMVGHVINGTRVCWPIRKKIARALGVSLDEICQEEKQHAA